MTIRVLIADHQQLLREAIAAIFHAPSDISVTALVADGRAAIEAVETHRPHVALLTLAMAEFNGIEATRRIAARFPDTRVLALAQGHDGHEVRAVLDAGARGCATRDTPAAELIQAVRLVASNKPFLSADIAHHLPHHPFCRSSPRRLADPLPPAAALGPREREVLQLIAEGRTSPQIAATLHIAVKTVESHRRHIMEKLDLHNVADLTKYAVRRGITSLEI